MIEGAVKLVMKKQFVGLTVLALVFTICATGTANPKKTYHHGKASWNAYKGTSYARKGLMITASRDYPCGSVIEVTNPKNKKKVLVTVRDWGPARRTGRVLDLSRKAFSKLASSSSGVIYVKYRLLKRGHPKHEQHRH